MFLGWKHAYTSLRIGEYNKTSLNIFFDSYVLLRVGAYLLFFFGELANNIVNPHSFPFCLLLECGFWDIYVYRVGAKLEKIFGQCQRYGTFMVILMIGQFCFKGP